MALNERQKRAATPSTTAPSPSIEPLVSGRCSQASGARSANASPEPRQGSQRFRVQIDPLAEAAVAYQQRSAGRDRPLSTAVPPPASLYEARTEGRTDAWATSGPPLAPRLGKTRVDPSHAWCWQPSLYLSAVAESRPRNYAAAALGLALQELSVELKLAAVVLMRLVDLPEHVHASTASTLRSALHHCTQLHEKEVLPCVFRFVAQGGARPSDWVKVIHTPHRKQTSRMDSRQEKGQTEKPGVKHTGETTASKAIFSGAQEALLRSLRAAVALGVAEVEALADKLTEHFDAVGHIGKDALYAFKRHSGRRPCSGATKRPKDVSTSKSSCSSRPFLGEQRQCMSATVPAVPRDQGTGLTWERMPWNLQVQRPDSARAEPGGQPMQCSSKATKFKQWTSVHDACSAMPWPGSGCAEGAPDVPQIGPLPWPSGPTLQTHDAEVHDLTTTTQKELIVKNGKMLVAGGNKPPNNKRVEEKAVVAGLRKGRPQPRPPSGPKPVVREIPSNMAVRVHLKPPGSPVSQVSSEDAWKWPLSEDD